MRDSWLQSYGLLKNIYLEPAANSTSRLLQLDSVFPPGSFVHQDSEKYNITWYNTLSCTHPRGPSGHCLLGTLPCGFYLRSCNRSFPSPETQPDCSVAGGEVGEAGRDGKVVSLEEVRQDQVPQVGGSSVQRQLDCHLASESETVWNSNFDFYLPLAGGHYRGQDSGQTLSVEGDPLDLFFWAVLLDMV